MRWRNGLMGLSSIAKAPVSHGVQNPMILRQSDASRCPGLQPLTPTLAAHRESGLVRRRRAVIRIAAVDVEVSGKGAAQGTRASQPPRQSEHLNIVDSPERAVNQTCLVLRGEIQREP